MSFINSDLNKQAQAEEVTFSRTTKSYHSQTCFNNILRIYLNEKLNFYHHVLERNAQVRLENLVFLNNLFINLNIIEIINTTLNKLTLQYFIAEQTFLNIYNSHQPEQTLVIYPISYNTN